MQTEIRKYKEKDFNSDIERKSAILEKDFRKCLLARDYCKGAIKLKPSFTTAYNLLGLIELYIGGFDAESKYMETSRKVIYKSFYDCKIGQKDSIWENSLINALHNYAISIARDHRTRGTSGSFYLSNWRLRRAIWAIRLAKLVKPHVHETYYVEGRVYYEFMFYDNAYDSFKKAVDLFPEDLKYRANLAAAVIRSCRWDELDECTKNILECPTRVRYDSMKRIVRAFETIQVPKANDNKQPVNNTVIAEILINRFILKAIMGFSDICNKVLVDRDTLLRSKGNEDIFNLFKEKIDLKCNFLEMNADIIEMDNQLLWIWYLLLAHRHIYFNYKLSINYDENSLLIMPSDIKDVQTFNQSIANMISWMTGQLWAIQGRHLIYLAESGKTKIECAKIPFDNALAALKDYPQEIKEQKLRSYYAYVLAKSIKFDIYESCIGEDNNGNFQDIYDLTSMAIDEDPLDWMAPLARAELHLRRGDYQEAYGYFNSALSLMPKPKWRPSYLWTRDEWFASQGELILKYGICLIKASQIQSPLHIRKENLKNGIEATEYALELFQIEDGEDIDFRPKREWCSKTYFWIGRGYFEKGDFIKAAECFCQSLELMPPHKKENDVPVFYLGKAYQRARMLPEAIAMFDRIKEPKISTLPEKGTVSKIDCENPEGKNLTDDYEWVIKEPPGPEEMYVMSLLYSACCHAGCSSSKAAGDKLKKAKEQKPLKDSYSNKHILARCKAALNACQGIVGMHGNAGPDINQNLIDAIAHEHDPDILEHLQFAFMKVAFKSQDEKNLCLNLAEALLMAKMSQNSLSGQQDNKTIDDIQSLIKMLKQKECGT
ncbi:hypothetical protein CHISP_3727 [Chitinispirillum alkaliphilum]|nr:hypothetical protein CHISP_3727 [Chitinispirillum alkaliphilum]